MIWLYVGNGSTADLHSLVRAHLADFAAFDGDRDAALLVLTL